MAGLNLTFLSGSQFPDIQEIAETGETYRDNAFLKASTYSIRTGFPALGDDSGLEVDALNGNPGIKSNRFFGEGLNDAERIDRLLTSLHGVQDQARSARFRCTVVLAIGTRLIISVSETVEGIILDKPRGSGGFGYDPVFLISELNRTFGELPPEVKNRISHRGKALRHIRDFLLLNDHTSW